VSTLDDLTEKEIHKKLDLDLHYLRNVRTVSDLRILLKTLVVLAKKVARA
jgi:lipopolysaccharide/colanic/teichoic acid biosynthesis glycosyltransferase